MHPVEDVEELVEGVGAQVAKHHILQLFCLIVVENVMENENVNENVIIWEFDNVRMWLWVRK